MAPEAVDRYARSLETLCSPAPRSSSRQWSRGTSRTEAFFLRTTNLETPGSSSANRRPTHARRASSAIERDHGRRFVRTRSEGATVLDRLPHRGASAGGGGGAPSRLSVSQSHHGQNGQNGIHVQQSSDGFPGRPRLSLDAAAAMASAAAQSPFLYFSGPLPRGVQSDLASEDSPRNPRSSTARVPTAPRRRLGQSSSWIESREKPTWQEKARRWLPQRSRQGSNLNPGGGGFSSGFLPEPAPRTGTRVGSLIAHSDGLLAQTLREEVEEAEEEGADAPSTRPLFCPSSRSFLNSVATSSW